MKSFTRHLPHYLSLLGILFFGALGFVVFSYDQAFQISISVAVAVSYVVWGVVHHKLHRDFDWAVVIEYLAVAILGLMIIFSLIFRV